MATSWQEIKALAQDLKRAQLSSTAQRLSERDCIQIIQQLISRGQLQLIHTQDGRTFLTPEELSKELLEELEAHEGRVNLVDVASSLSVDFSCVEARAQDLLRSGSSGLHLVLGQLIQASYVRRVVQEVRDLVWEQGHVTLGQLTKQYDLPAAFIRNQILLPHLGNLLDAQLDGERLYTERYLSRHRARIRGYLAAALRPVAMTSAAHLLDIDDVLFRKLSKELIHEGYLKGQLVAGGAQYVPDCYSIAQRQWVTQFFDQNGYLEWATLRRLGIQEPERFVSLELAHVEGLRMLPSCCLNAHWVGQIEATVHETLRLGGWIDVSNCLSMCALSEDDLVALVQPLLRQEPCQVQSQLLASNSCVVSGNLLMKLTTILEVRLAAAAEKALISRSASGVPGSREVQLKDSGFRKDDQSAEGKRGKKGGGGGSHQGREIKTRHVKKKYLSKREELDDEEDEGDEKTLQLGQYVKQEEMQEAVRHELALVAAAQNSGGQIESTAAAEQIDMDAVPADLVDELVDCMLPKWQRRFEEALQSAFLQTSNTAQSRAGRQKTQERLQSLIHHIRLFEKGASCLAVVPVDSSSSVKQLHAELLRHLLRTLCTEMLNLLVQFAAAEVGVLIDTVELSVEQRVKTMSQLSNRNVYDALLRLHQVVSRGTGSAEEVLELYAAVDLSCENLGFLLRKTDKRQEKQLCSELAAQMTSQLEELASPAEGGDPAMLLLLAVSLCSQQASGGLPLHIPGRSVAGLLEWLAPRLTKEVHALLTEFQRLVVRRVKAQAGGESMQEEMSSVLLALNERAAEVRLAGLQWKKSGAGKN